MVGQGQKAWDILDACHSFLWLQIQDKGNNIMVQSAPHVTIPCKESNRKALALQQFLFMIHSAHRS